MVLMETENLLLTGGTGFIGSYLSRLLRKNHTVSTFERHVGYDIRNERQVTEAISHKTAILHFAATAVGREAIMNHPEATAIDLLGLQNILMAAAKEKAFLVYPSSTLALGNDAYGALKKTSEDLINSTPDLRYTILRL